VCARVVARTHAWTRARTLVIQVQSLMPSLCSTNGAACVHARVHADPCGIDCVAVCRRGDYWWRAATPPRTSRAQCTRVPNSRNSWCSILSAAIHTTHWVSRPQCQPRQYPLRRCLSLLCSSRKCADSGASRRGCYWWRCYWWQLLVPEPRLPPSRRHLPPRGRRAFRGTPQLRSPHGAPPSSERQGQMRIYEESFAEERLMRLVTSKFSSLCSHWK
jgi:hypothetical protein